MHHFTIWSEKDIEILKVNYHSAQTRSQLLALLPEKKWTSIRHKANELGLRKDRLGIWSRNELEILNDNWRDKTPPQLLELLPFKKWSSIRHKAFDLHLKKTHHRTRYWHTYREVPTIVMSDAQRGYFAGIVDGEGHIRIAHSMDRGQNYYSPFLGITNTNMALMQKCKEIFPIGRFIAQKQQNPKHKPKLVYNVASVCGVKQILERIIDLLIIKKPQAELVLEFIKIKQEKDKYGLDPKEEELYLKIRHLNYHGDPEKEQKP